MDSLKYILAADIGGTYTRIGVFTPRGQRKVYHRFENVRYPSASALLHDFRVRHGLSFSKVCVAVAGPVRAGVATMPNLAWQVSEELLAHTLLVKDVKVVNDAHAAAAALENTPLVQVKAGRQEDGVRAVIGPGTGLGCSYSVWDGKRYLSCASEGGHVDFAPSTEREAALWEYAKRRFAHVSAERLISGPGLVTIYNFLRDERLAVESEAERKAIAASYSPAKAIMDAGVAQNDSLAALAVTEFTSLFGSFAGSYALSLGATGGVYLFGSLANRLVPLLKESGFEHAFSRKGRMRPYLERIPVFVVKDPDVVLKGAYLLAKT